MFTMTITAPDGNIGGLRYIDAANWTGKGIVIPKPVFAKMDKSEIDKPGVYILMSRSGVVGSRQPRIYIGEGDPAKDRIESHAKKVLWWNEAVIFVSTNESLDKTKIQWIEAELIRRARTAGHAIMDQKTMNFPTVRPAVQAECKSFTDTLICSLALINVDYFDVSDVTAAVIEEPKKVRSAIVPPPATPAVIPAPVTSFPETPDEEDAVYPREVPVGVVNEMLAGVELADEARICIIGDDKLIAKVMHKWPNAKLYFVGVTAKHNNKIQRRYCGTVTTMTQEDLFSQSAVKFDLIIGNPPYNEAPSETNIGRATIWHLFVNKSLDMSKRYVSMIVPARWYTGGTGLNDFRDSFGANKNLVSIYDIPNGVPEWESAEVNIGGGVCYFLIDKNKTSETCKWVNTETHETWTRSIPLLTSGVVLRHLSQQRVVDLVKQRADEFLIPFNSNSYSLRTYESPSPTGTPCWFNSAVKNKFNLQTNLGKINKPFIDRDGNLNTYRVITSKAYASGTDKKVLSTSTFVASPGELCTESFLVLKSFTNRRSAENFRTYITTKFARYLIRCVKNTQDAAPKVYQFVPIVPDQPWTDEELYRHFRIPKDLINIIETTIDEWRDDDQDD